MKEIKVGVIGGGSRGWLAESNKENIKRKIRVAGICDIKDSILEEYKKKYSGDILVTKNYKDVLKIKDLDAVFICTPDFLHEEHALAALSMKHTVFLEKPMAITIAGCDRILKAAKDNRAKLFVGHNMRYMAFTRQMKKIIDDGIIGDVKAIWCRHFVSYGGDAYFRDWHSERKNTTGLLLQKGAHDIDIIHWLAGSYTKKVTAFGSLSIYDKCKRSDAGIVWNQSNWPPLEQTGMSRKIDVEDQNMVLMELENGVMASYLQCHFTPDAFRNYTIIGTRGRIENMDETTTVHVWNKRVDGCAKPDIVYNLPGQAGGHGGADPTMLNEFFEFVTTGCKTYTSPVAARYSVSTGCQATMSLRNGGKPLSIPKLNSDIAKYFNSLTR